MKKEERYTFLKRSYFKLKEEHPGDVPEFDSDREIEIERVDTTGTIFNRELEFAEHPHEI